MEYPDSAHVPVQVSLIDLNARLMTNQIDAMEGLVDWGSVSILRSPVVALRVVSVSLTLLVTLHHIRTVMRRPVSIAIEADFVPLTVRGILWSERELDYGTKLHCPILERMHLLKKVITLPWAQPEMKNTSLQKITVLFINEQAATLP